MKDQKERSTGAPITITAATTAEETSEGNAIMALLMKITVFGTPAPQGSKSFKGRSKTGKAIMVESSKKVGPWRETVVYAARDEMNTFGGWSMITDPILMHVRFSLRRPASHYRTGRNAHLLRESAPTRPGKYPDLSKLIRSTEDALTTAGVYADDALIVDLNASKVFAGSSGGLDVSGAVIEIWGLDS
jgi:Holliday junction resolvase RusA-like endonuclease